ncbi:MAG: uracil-DNA glycosylase [Kordiimonadales bacterium]|nr:MAG: uracil-DNA glycosylase [Kordiimonadales bacterium]
MPSAPFIEPDRECTLCPRLVEFRTSNKTEYPDYFNGAITSFGAMDAPFLIIGLAPGLKGANKTGRPFTGDFSGALLFKCLEQMGWANDKNQNTPGDGFELIGTCVTNAVCCVPPQNKPTAAEVNNCRPFLLSRLDHMPNVKILMALGRLAHDSTLRTFGLRLADYKFGHAARHLLPNGLILVDSYHVSRYNVNTGVLTEDMFMDALRLVEREITA